MPNTNTDFDPESTEFPPEPPRHAARPYLLLALYLLLLALIFLLSLSPGRGGGSGGGVGNGSGSTEGSGTGEGISGNGSGSGEKNGETGNGEGISGNGSATGRVPDTQTKPETSSPRKEIPPSSTPPSSEQTRSSSDSSSSRQVPPPNRRLSEWSTTETASPQQETRSGKQSSSGASGGGGFFGIEVKAAAKVIFLVDISGSMNSVTSEKKRWIDVMKEELTQTVLRLQSRKHATTGFGARTEGGYYRVAAFSDATTDFPINGAIRFSDQRSLPELKAFLLQLEPQSGTAMLSAWKHIQPYLQDAKIDTVYFLTDGDPTDCSEEELLAFLKQTLSKDLTVHTVSIGQSSELLKRIASQHHGRYVEKQ